MRTLGACVLALGVQACALAGAPKVLAFEYAGRAELFTLEEVDTARAVEVHPMCTPLAKREPAVTCTVAIPEGWGGRRVFLRVFAGGAWSPPGRSVVLPVIR